MPAYGSQITEPQKKAGVKPLPFQELNQQNDPMLEEPQHMSQIPMYHDGGDVPKNQVAKLAGGERVLNPVETHAYKSAAIGNAPSTILGRIAERAHEIYNQGKALIAPEDSEAAAFKEKQQGIDAALGKPQADTQMKPLAPATQSPMDRINSSATYGERAPEKRLDSQGNVIEPTTPAGLGAVGPKLPEPTALGKPLPSYDEGGDVPDDQVAKVHEDEHVLDPEKAAAYRQAEAEVKQFPEPQSGPVEVKADTDNPPAPKDSIMNTSNAPAETPMQLASTKTPLGTTGAPKPTHMRALPFQVAPEAEKPKPPAEEVAPDPMAIIQQDKLEAAKKGHAGLSDLGLAMIHENAFKKPAYTGTPQEMKVENQKEGKEKHEQTVKDLTDKMLHGATEQERFQAEKDLAEYKRRTPWGGDESAHPGTLGKIGHVLGQIGQAALMPTAPYLAEAIPGSQVRLREDAARSEQGVEQAQKKEMSTAQLATEQQKPEMKEMQAEQAEQKIQNAQNALLRKQQLKVDASGHQVPLTYEELTPQEQGAYDLQQAKSNAQNGIAALKQAQADPDSPQSKLIIAKAEAEGKKLDLAGQKLGLDVAKYKADYLGLDQDNKPLAGVQTTEAGAPVGVKVGKGNEATAMRLNKADLSQNVQLNAKNAIQLLTDRPDLFGKVAGRFTNAKQMAGTDDEDIVRLGIQVHNMAVASAGIHGQRGQAAVEAYEKDILNKFHNSAKATIAGLNEISGSVQTFIDDAKSGKKVAPTPENTPTPETAKYHMEGKAGQILSNDGKTWYDLQGKKIEAKKKEGK